MYSRMVNVVCVIISFESKVEGRDQMIEVRGRFKHATRTGGKVKSEALIYVRTRTATLLDRL
jgi:hypothetical protein